MQTIRRIGFKLGLILIPCLMASCASNAPISKPSAVSRQYMRLMEAEPPPLPTVTVPEAPDVPFFDAPFLDVHRKTGYSRAQAVADAEAFVNIPAPTEGVSVPMPAYPCMVYYYNGNMELVAQWYHDPVVYSPNVQVCDAPTNGVPTAGFFKTVPLVEN